MAENNSRFNESVLIGARKNHTLTSRQARALRWVLPALTVLTVLILYLITASREAGIGYPLDDAWIHQTYARNLGLLGQWSFIPGQPSAGSTAPLWSLLLAAGYVLRLPHFAWTFLLGGLSLFALALAGEGLFRTLVPQARGLIPVAAVLLASEWHLAWAALSGMETLLFAALILLVLWRSVQPAAPRAWFVTGLLIGLSVWVRPDGVTLLGPAAFCLVLSDMPRRQQIRAMLALAAGALLMFLPYLLFNLLVQGSLWPNTFYAKQAEYAELRRLSIFTRFFTEVSLPLIGGGLFLLPGFLVLAWQAVRARRWTVVAAVLWFLGYALLYALRLPVTYQYGRYFMPAMPVYFLLGLAGTYWLVAAVQAKRIGFILSRVWLLSGVAVWLAFLVIGAGRFAKDAGIIETEMVAAAKWVAANTDSQARIAAHDIGALGYFGSRQILDLAGLVSPEVIPFIRDEQALADWLDTRQADYLVIFSGWYQTLPGGKTPVYQTTGEYSIPAGGKNTQVYRWKP